MSAEARADGQKIVLSDESGTEVLSYDKLKVWDAENKDLTARMTTNETGEIRLEVEDQEAVYPLTIDPIFVQRQKLTASDGAASNYFGNSLAISGDTAVIGAYGNSSNRGAAYIFVRSGTIWTQQAKLVAADGASGDAFGFGVSISGDTVVIGAQSDTIGNNSSQGSAYVFVRSGTSWTAQAKLTADDGAAFDHFGNSAGISGDSVVIGAFSDDIGSNNDQGSAYVFVRSGGAWTPQAKLTANDGAATDQFGFSTAISGSTIIVGANKDDIGSNLDQGSAYIFIRNGTAWSQQAKLVASDGSAGDVFGIGVDITNTLSGPIAVIGASVANVGGNPDQGAAYVFTRGQLNIWSQTQKLIASDGDGYANFGHSVAIAPITGNTIIVGAYIDNVGSNNIQGAAYVFKRAGSVWTQQQKLTANDGAAGDSFGNSVAISGETAMIGAQGDNIGSNTDQGAAYTFDLTTGASPFDFDGDGKTDVSIFRASNGQWWYYRSSDGGAKVATFGTGSDRLVPGDFTGDGKVDIALFRPSNGNWFILRSEDGSFYSFPFGSAGDLPAPGDFDGDGKTDAAVFRPSNSTWYISRSSDGGTSIIAFGAAGDLPVPADYDGDGKTDIAIYRPSNGQWWLNRSTQGVIAITFGNSTDKAVEGDYTGDGKADVAIWRPSTGEWFILRSEDFSFYAVPFGISTDLPTPGDYDGDGKFDTAVFRPSNAVWYINRSTAGVLIQQFGLSSDKPVPNAFIP